MKKAKACRAFAFFIKKQDFFIFLKESNRNRLTIESVMRGIRTTMKATAVIFFQYKKPLELTLFHGQKTIASIKPTPDFHTT